MGVLIIIGLRLVVPITIVRWPLWGGIIAMLLDGADVIIADALSLITQEPGGMGTHYHALDKWLDMYYLTLEAGLSLRWKHRIARITGVILFLYRVIGSVNFEISGARIVLFFFPNLFENFFLFYGAAVRFAPRLLPHTARTLLLALLILSIPKFIQEWILHYAQLQPWNWLKEMVLPLFP